MTSEDRQVCSLETELAKRDVKGELRPLFNHFLPGAPQSIYIWPAHWPLLLNLQKELVSIDPAFGLYSIGVRQTGLQVNFLNSWGPTEIPAFKAKADACHRAVAFAQAVYGQTCEICAAAGEVQVTYRTYSRCLFHLHALTQ